MKKIAAITTALVLSLVALFVVANRSLGDLLGYFRAGASTTVKSIENEIPDAIHDEKTQAEMTAARKQMIDRQVQLNLSQNQLNGLKEEIEALVAAVNSRKQVLASAYPILEQATNGHQSQVTFVSTKFSLPEFQHEIDDLLSMQERDETALKIKQQGYERLASSVADGEMALAEMKNKMLEIEQDFAVLKTRRDQAHMESATLDMVAGATSDGSSTTASVGKSVERLAGQVEQLEARNDARREVASVEQRVSSGKLTQTFNRLEALKRYASEQNAAVPSTVPSDTNKAAKQSTAVDAAGALNSSKISAQEVVIQIRGDQERERCQVPLLVT